VGGVEGWVLTHQVLCVALDLFFGKNEAKVGGLPGKSFALMANEEVGRFGELAALQVAALFLDVAELIERSLELAGEARAVQAKRGQLRDQVLWVGVLGEELGFEGWNAVEAPGGVGHFVDQLSFGGGGGGVFVEKLLYVALVSFGVLGGQDSCLGSETMAQRVEGRTLLARFGARAGGVLGVGAVGGSALGF
jgi:hypothetical protein